MIFSIVLITSSVGVSLTTYANTFAPDQEKAKKWAAEVLPLVEKVKEEGRFNRSKRLWDMKLGLKDVKHRYFLLDSPIIKKEEDNYRPVRFTHSQHSSWIKNCNACHHVRPAKAGSSEIIRCSACHQESFNPKVSSRVGLKAAYHLQCLGCHNKMGKGPADCLGCHAKNGTSHEQLVKLPKNPKLNQVTAECLRCHETAGAEVMDSAHWGKWVPSDKFHVTYASSSALSDKSDKTQIDCLVCHDRTGTYKKKNSNDSTIIGTDLVAVAKNVGRVNRENCGQCHFQDKQGENAIYSELTTSFKKPDRSLDIHMGGFDFQCQECHQTRKHNITGMNETSGFGEGRVTCEQCHGKTPHGDGPLDNHLNKHVEHMVCNTCHSPLYGKGEPTIASWDWSKATTNGKTGGMIWKKNNKAEYRWYDGNITRHNSSITVKGHQRKINEPEGDIRDPNSRITPFEIVRVRRAVDTENKQFLDPKLTGPDGMWQAQDWAKAFQAGNKSLNLPFSGKFEWADTLLFKGVQHEVTPREMALSCVQCHTSLSQGCLQCHSNYSAKRTCNRCHQDNKTFSFKGLVEKGLDFDRYYHRGRQSNKYVQSSDYLDFQKLGYKGDPVIFGGRFKKLPLGYDK